MNQLYDPVRQRLVEATPEERVRQELLRKMIGELGYPQGLIAIEKKIEGLDRRIDLLCYGSHRRPERELSPLLLIECKRDHCTEEAREQLFGYNATVKAPFICLAGKTDIITLWVEKCKIASVPFLPSYRDLFQMARRYFASSA